MPENPTNDMTQNAKAKSPKAQLVAQIARLVKKAGLDYEGWRYVSKRVRRLCDLRPEKKGRRLPRVLTTEEFRRFYQVVDRAEDVQHALMLRLLFFTAVRVSELCNMLDRRSGSRSLQDQDQPGQGLARTVTSSSASPSPRPCERTSPPTPITAGSSRPRGMASSAPGGSSRSSPSTPRRRESRRPLTPSGTRRSLG